MYNMSNGSNRYRESSWMLGVSFIYFMSALGTSWVIVADTFWNDWTFFSSVALIPNLLSLHLNNNRKHLVLFYHIYGPNICRCLFGWSGLLPWICIRLSHLMKTHKFMKITEEQSIFYEIWWPISVIRGLWATDVTIFLVLVDKAEGG